ncbi:hypothetical protein ACUXS5_001769 [Staphylococcus epidermidis]
MITDISTSESARAVCCASTALIFKSLGLLSISFVVPFNPKFFLSLIKPADSNNLSARAWLDTSFGMATCAPFLTSLMFLTLSE